MCLLLLSLHSLLLRSPLSSPLLSSPPRPSPPSLPFPLSVRGAVANRFHVTAVCGRVRSRRTDTPRKDKRMKTALESCAVLCVLVCVRCHCPLLRGVKPLCCPRAGTGGAERGDLFTDRWPTGTGFVSHFPRWICVCCPSVAFLDLFRSHPHHRPLQLFLSPPFSHTHSTAHPRCACLPA
jgi:hypothetical protein